ncbi:MAG: DUF2321 domain-containing protein [Ruminococcaceae bacterium]|nr:DUF2321 domain-containing protein [Oscillospiraceae bacterium]
MASYYVAAVCTNGHMISSTLSSTFCNRNFCEECGAKVITSCSNCNTPIAGAEMDDPSDSIVFISSSTPVPKYCPNCGNPYPWTEKAALSLIRMLREEDDLDQNLIDRLEESLPDTICETPATELAAVRFRKLLGHAGGIFADAVKQYLSAYGCEKIKTILSSFF